MAGQAWGNDWKEVRAGSGGGGEGAGPCLHM